MSLPGKNAADLMPLKAGRNFLGSLFFFSKKEGKFVKTYEPGGK